MFEFKFWFGFLYMWYIFFEFFILVFVLFFLGGFLYILLELFFDLIDVLRKVWGIFFFCFGWIVYFNLLYFIILLIVWEFKILFCFSFLFVIMRCSFGLLFFFVYLFNFFCCKGLVLGGLGGNVFVGFLLVMYLFLILLVDRSVVLWLIVWVIIIEDVWDNGFFFVI